MNATDTYLLLRAFCDELLRRALSRSILHRSVRGIRLGVVLCVVLVAGLLSTAVADARTYYVCTSPVSGGSCSDSNSGTTPTSAWKTVAHVNSITFSPGDVIEFHGGDRFTDAPITPPSAEAGTSTHPITYQSFGTGQAIVGTSGDQAVYLTGGQHDLVFNDLKLIPPGAPTINAQGAVSSGGRSNATKDYDVTVSNCTIDYWRSGIVVAPYDSSWTIKDNVIGETSADGIYIGRVSDVGGTIPPGDQTGDVITGNTITHTGEANPSTPSHAIYDNSLNSAVTGNTITNFQASGITVRFRNSVVEANVIDGSSRGEDGISFFNYDTSGGTSTWAYNEIKDVTETGIYIAKQAGPDLPDTMENFYVLNNSIVMHTRPGTGTAKIAVEYTSGWVRIANNVATGHTDYELLTSMPIWGPDSHQQNDMWWNGSGIGEDTTAWMPYDSASIAPYSTLTENGYPSLTDTINGVSDEERVAVVASIDAFGR